MAAKKAKRSKARKPGAKRVERAKAPGRKRSTTAGPVAVKTGKGPAPLEIANRVAALLRAGNTAEVEDKWLAAAIESVEGLGAAMAWKGKKSVLAKYRAWEAENEIRDMKIEGPWVGATGFALKYAVDVVHKATGQVTKMEEIAVYTVRNGQIVREEFHFAAE